MFAIFFFINIFIRSTSVSILFRWIFNIKGNWKFQKLNFGSIFWGSGRIYQKSNNAVLLCYFSWFIVQNCKFKISLFFHSLGSDRGELSKNCLIAFRQHIDYKSVQKLETVALLVSEKRCLAMTNRQTDGRMIKYFTVFSL